MMIKVYQDGVMKYLQDFLTEKGKIYISGILKHEQRVVICQEIAQRPIHTCVTFSDKATIPGSQWARYFKRPGHLYNYLVRWLLERTTSYCLQDSAIRGNKNTSVKVVFLDAKGQIIKQCVNIWS